MIDALAQALPSTTDSDRPWLTWYSPDERIELTGHVVSMWQAKCASLVAAEVGPDATVHLEMTPHWRTVTWCAGVWLTRGAILLPPTDGALVEKLPTTTPNLSVTFRNHWLFPPADVQVLVSKESFATCWPTALPPLALDGIAEAMSYADRFDPLPAEGDEPALLVVHDGELRTVSRDALAASTPRAAAEAARAAGARALLVREETTERAMLGVLAAWQTGLTALLASPDADASLIAAAVRQEGAAGA